MDKFYVDENVLFVTTPEFGGIVGQLVGDGGRTVRSGRIVSVNNSDSVVFRPHYIVEDSHKKRWEVALSDIYKVFPADETFREKNEQLAREVDMLNVKIKYQRRAICGLIVVSTVMWVFSVLVRLELM